MSQVIKNKCTYSYPTGFKRYAKREIKKDKVTGLSYIGYVVNAKGEKMYDDWYAKIQKPIDSCNVRILLERAVQSDNTAILNQRQKVSADLSGLPDNLLDVLNDFQSVKNYFESLPVDVKRDFSNNVYEFVKRQGKISDNLVKYYENIHKSNAIIEPIKNDEEKGDDK